MTNPYEEALKRLRPEQLEALARAARERAAKAPGNAPGVRVRVVLTEGHTLKARPDNGPPAGDDLTARALSRLSPQLKAAFIGSESKVLAWLRASQDNRTQFTLDPVGSLKKIVPGFDRKLIAEIESLRAASSRVAVDAPGVKLDSLKLEVEAQRKNDGRKEKKR